MNVMVRMPFLRGSGSQDFLIKAFTATVKGFAKSEQWTRFLLRWLKNQGLTVTAHVHKSWPDEVPCDLPNGLPQFVGLGIQDRVHPALIFRKSDIDAYRAAMRQRKAVLDAHAVQEGLVEECGRKESFALKSAKELEKNINQIVTTIDAASPVREPRSNDDEGQRLKLEDLKREFKRIEWLREDLAQERAALISNILVQHSDAWITQIQADRSLETHLKSIGQLQNNEEDFGVTWNLLPPLHRRSRTLEEAWKVFQLRQKHRTGAPNEVLWTMFVNDQENDVDSFYSAVVRYEIARVSLESAKWRCETYGKHEQIRDEEYKMARVAKREVVTPSQHARQCLKERAPFLHAFVQAEQDFRMATERLADWNGLDEDNMNPYAFVPREYSESSESIRFNAAILGESPRVRVPRVHLSKEKVDEIGTWEAGIQSIRAASIDSIASSKTTKVSLKVSSLGESDPVSVFEVRRYNRVRAQQWGNMRYDENAHFGVAKARVPASLAPLTGTKRLSDEIGLDEMSNSSESSKRLKDAHNEDEEDVEGSFGDEVNEDINDARFSEGR